MSDVKELANFLAAEHRQEDATIEAIYWLPHDSEVRLIELTKSVRSPALRMSTCAGRCARPSMQPSASWTSCAGRRADRC